MSNRSTVERRPVVVRESDGRRQLVPYPGWKLIAERIAARRKAGR